MPFHPGALSTRWIGWQEEISNHSAMKMSHLEVFWLQSLSLHIKHGHADNNVDTALETHRCMLRQKYKTRTHGQMWVHTQAQAPAHTHTHTHTQMDSDHFPPD